MPKMTWVQILPCFVAHVLQWFFSHQTTAGLSGKLLKDQPYGGARGKTCCRGFLFGFQSIIPNEWISDDKYWPATEKLFPRSFVGNITDAKFFMHCLPRLVDAKSFNAYLMMHSMLPTYSFPLSKNKARHKNRVKCNLAWSNCYCHVNIFNGVFMQTTMIRKIH